MTRAVVGVYSVGNIGVKLLFTFVGFVFTFNPITSGIKSGACMAVGNGSILCAHALIRSACIAGAGFGRLKGY